MHEKNLVIEHCHPSKFHYLLNELSKHQKHPTAMYINHAAYPDPPSRFSAMDLLDEYELHRPIESAIPYPAVIIGPSDSILSCNQAEAAVRRLELFPVFTPPDRICFNTNDVLSKLKRSPLWNDPRLHL